MSLNGAITEDEHFVPQVYLRGFSPQYLMKNAKDIPYSKYCIYEYRLNDGQCPHSPVPIHSICYKKNIYEVTGENGEIVLRNHLEKVFGAFEKNFSKYRHKLESKVFFEENLNIRCFLTRDEKLFWIVYIVIQILRSPLILEAAKQVTLEEWPVKVNELQAKNIAILHCLPLFEELTENSKYRQVFDFFINPMLGMSFGVGVDYAGGIVTSDNPVYICKNDEKSSEYDEVIFPISSKICLFLYGGELKHEYPLNSLFAVDDDMRMDIIKAVSSSAIEWVYSNHPIDGDEINNIMDIMPERKRNR